MKYFNKIFKKIILENQLYIDNKFPAAFSFSDYGLQFIFDIMPTFGVKYIWHTLNDLKNIPELIQTLQNTQQYILDEIANGFYDEAQNISNNAFDNQFPDEELTDSQVFTEIGNWIKSIKDDTEENTDFTEPINQSQELNIHDTQCFNTVPNVVKQVTPRPYRRGLKALSIANRIKFNKERSELASQDLVPHENTELEKDADILNKIKTQTNIQQPISKDVIKPMPGVKRPLGLNRNQKKIKHTFSNIVYQPSITQLTKQTAKKRCLTQRKSNKLYNEDTQNDLEFSTDYTTQVKPYIKPKSVDETQPQIKKELCIICKEYVQPKETILKSGKKILECPRCGLRITNNNY